MMGKNNPMKIKYWSDKMEFQGRGAGHIHGVAWCDLAEISKLIKEEKKVGVVLHPDENTLEKERVALQERKETVFFASNSKLQITNII